MKIAPRSSNGQPRIVPALLLAGLVAFALTSARAAPRGEPAEELEIAEVFIEWNSTDMDFGIQFFWDGEPWKRMTVRNDDGKVVLDVQAQRNVRKQGLTEGFFESAEPPTSELSMQQFLARFPEGEYEFRGRTLEDVRLEGTAEFTHTLPAPPTNLSPAGGDVVSHEGFTASFTGVTQDVQGNPLDIELYQVIVEKENDEPILQVFSVILRPGQTSVFVPEQFLEPNTEYKLEVIAQEESGNRTIAETDTFTTDS